MKKDTEVVEFFFCPHCSRACWERVDYFPFTSKMEYACLAECDHCGEEVLVVDHVDRCTKCQKKVECMAMPLKHTFSIASVPSSEINSHEIKELLLKLEGWYGIQV